MSFSQCLTWFSWLWRLWLGDTWAISAHIWTKPDCILACLRVCWMSFSPEECDEVRRKYGWLGLSSTLSRGFHDGILVWSQCDHHRPIESHWGMVFCLFPNMFPTSHVSMFGESGWQMDDIKNGVQAPGCWAGIQHDFNAELLGGPFLNSSTCQWVVDIYGTDHWLFNIAMV